MEYIRNMEYMLFNRLISSGFLREHRKFSGDIKLGPYYTFMRKERGASDSTNKFSDNRILKVEFPTVTDGPLRITNHPGPVLGDIRSTHHSLNEFFSNTV